jgi:hypothetical protein
MRRFLLILLILSLVVALAGSLTAVVLLYQSGQRTQADLNGRATRVAELESTLGSVEADLDDISATREALAQEVRAQSDQIATLEADVATLAAPAPTEESVVPTSLPLIVSLTAPAAGTEFQEGREVTIHWQASTLAGVAYLTLQVDGQPVSVYEVETPRTVNAEGEFTWVAAGEGVHDLKVIPVSATGEMAGAPASLSINVIPVSDAGGSDPATLAVMDAIEDQVIELRGLEPQYPVTRTQYTRLELEAHLVSDLEEEMTPEEAHDAVIEMAAFELLPLDTDLWNLYVALYTEQIAGFYDTDTETFAIIDDDGSFSALDKTVYAHEYVHALQDQSYDLDALDPGDANDDASLAVSSLVEGDATLTMQLYTLEFLDSNELYEALAESMNVDSEVVDSAPAAIVAQMTFPYEAGLAFAQALYQEGGFAAIDRAFADPPQSTEQILHPERYLAGELPQVVSLPPLTDTLGAGWDYVDGNVLGEFGLQLYLEEYLDDQVAATAADGWGGDWYAVHTSLESGRIVMVLRVVWDQESEAAEFMGAYRSFRKAHLSASPVGDSCWENEDAVCAYQSGDETLIIRAPDLELTGRLKSLFPDF